MFFFAYVRIDLTINAAPTLVSGKGVKMDTILQKLQDTLYSEAARGTFKGLSDETVLRVLFAFSAGYLHGFNVSFSEAYKIIMEFFDDVINGVLGANK